MLELCEILKININELFSGERLAMDQYSLRQDKDMRLRVLYLYQILLLDHFAYRWMQAYYLKR